MKMNFLRPSKILNILRSGKFVDFGKYEKVLPVEIGPLRSIPENIQKPKYYEDGIPQISPRSAEIKDTDQIRGMIQSCHLASTILSKVRQHLKPGITTDRIDEIVHTECIAAEAYPSPYNYRGFPKSICTSVNNVAVHGIPDLRPLIDGDIVNVDITVYYNGFHGDCSDTFLIGDVDDAGIELVSVTKECLDVGISVCGPDVPVKEIGWAINKHASQRGLDVMPMCLGHGIGEYFHGPPDIYHTRNRCPGLMLPGMTFTIEPVLTHGSPYLETLDDNWTMVTADGSRAAQAEHTVLITENGVLILTNVH